MTIKDVIKKLDQCDKNLYDQISILEEQGRDDEVAALEFERTLIDDHIEELAGIETFIDYGNQVQKKVDHFITELEAYIKKGR